MEDLIYLLFIGCLLVLALTVAMAAFFVAATIATIVVFGAAIHVFSVTMGRGLIHRGGSGAESGPGEPSFRAYYRGQVWADLGLATRAAGRRALDETARIRALVPTGWSPAVQGLTRFALSAYAFVGLAIGALLAALIGLVPALAIVLVAGFAWAVGAPLRAAERVRRRRSGAFFDCPECHDRFPLPRYVCPSCSARHAQLAPGPFGVRRHRCTCGARLPAMPSAGRERLLAECPQGHVLGEGVGTVRTFHIPVAGGPSTGKSTFLAAALIELDDAASAGTLATAVQSTSRQAYDRIIDGFRQGIRPPKTDGLPPAVVAEIRGRSKSALLYAYDVAGEIYGKEDDLRRDPAHGLAEGVVLLVDPFALERVRTDFQDEIDGAPELRPSIEAPQRMLERLLGVLGEQGVDLRKLSAAICVTKIDALGVADAMASAPGATDHERTRAWLEQSGAGNFVRAAEQSFHEIQCFGVSALGRMPGTGSGPFTPSGASAPLLWLLRRAGIEPAPVGEAQATQTQRIVTAAPIDVTPKRPLFTGQLDAVGSMGYTGNFFLGLAATGVLAAGAAPFASLSSSSSSASTFETASATVAPDTTPASGAGATTQPATGGTSPDSGDEAFVEDAPAPTATPRPRPKLNSPAGILRRHFQQINDGDYPAAFRLMSSRYRGANPNWLAQPNAAQPFVHVAEVGKAQFVGSGVARVYVKFYGRDRYATGRSDTSCRRFEGEAQMVKENGRWRYDGGDDYTTTVLPSSLKACNP